MRFHLFTIEYNDDGESHDLRDGIARISRISDMGKRELPVAGKIIALEKAENVDANLHLLDVMDARSNDFPGRYTVKKKNEDLPVERGDMASQRTMALYVRGEQADYLVCQYNHHGVKAGQVAYYLGDGEDVYILHPVIDDKAVRTFANSEGVTGFRIKIAASAQSAAWLRGTSLYDSVRRAATDHDAGFIEIRYSLGAGKKGRSLRDVKEMIRRVLFQGKDAPINQIPKTREELRNAGFAVEATVRRQFDAPPEVLDLLNQRVCHDVPDDALRKTAGGRYDYPSRKKAIVDSLSYFKKYMVG